MMIEPNETPVVNMHEVRAVIDRVETNEIQYHGGSVAAYVIRADDWREMRATLDRLAARLAQVTADRDQWRDAAFRIKRRNVENAKVVEAVRAVYHEAVREGRTVSPTDLAAVLPPTGEPKGSSDD